MSLNAIAPQTLESWVLDACGVIRASKTSGNGEPDPRRILIQCVLGSRVRHRTAVRAARAVWTRVMGLSHYRSTSELEELIYDVLARTKGYPFPRRGARLTAGALSWLGSSQDQLPTQHLEQAGARRMRRLLLDCPGLGPKQASLFLRSLRPLVRLAVLDTRVLAYLSHRLPSLVARSYPSTLGKYELIEDHYLEYADWVDEDPGVLDLAIWYVTRAVTEVQA